MNKYKYFPILALAVSVALSACGDRAEAPKNASLLADAPAGPVVAVVGGEAVTEPLLVVYARGHGFDPAVPDQREKALQSLIENILLTQDARATGLLDKPEVQAEATLVRIQQVAGRVIANKRASLQVTDEQIQQLYDNERARAGDTEWKVEHLLFADEASAQAALARATADGADFAALMAEYSVAGAKQAKALDWSNASQLPDEIVGALKQLQDGQIAPIVVKSSFGWHVVRRAESRPFSPPGIDTVREGARKQIVETAIKDYVKGLRAKTEISTGANSPAG